MKVLVVGNGGREDALCKKISESGKLTKLYCVKGNAGTLRYAENLDLQSTSDILDFSLKEKIDLVVIGPENPLCEGITDLFSANNIRVFGADKKSAQLEGSKDFAKRFMQEYGIPTARYKTVFSKEESKYVLKEFSYPLVIKADGLCAGKGVRICNSKTEAEKYIAELFDDKIFGEEGKAAVIEEFLTGKEASLLCFVSGNKIIPMESARDYKKIFDNDLGENTGGVGCYSPSELFDDTLKTRVHTVLEKISVGLKNEGLEYFGILFIGFMIDGSDIKILEFNVRFGDPETEVVLPRLKSDLLELIEKVFNKTLEEKDLKWKNKKCLTVVLTSEGYPGTYKKGKEISGLKTACDDRNVYIYHNNTKYKDGKILSDGGRVLSVTGLGESFEKIRKKIYKRIETIHFEGMRFRKDIGCI
ncbi:MAG: phosphoribosylamine--glycine ligase [Treponema lecithinolyticum]|uniref:phosphoribosylamine--glycine ligase n=1 Tax=Treponema lecithinolyticum TaxID=53418 RepID=UPI00361BB242